MRTLAVLLFLTPCLGQSTNTVKGICNSIVTGNGNTVTLRCDGLTREQGNQLLLILNRIAKDQLDPKAVMEKLDEIKELAARNSTSPETVAKGIQMYADGHAPTPKVIAQTTYQQLTGFLRSRDTLRRARQTQDEQLQRQMDQTNQAFRARAASSDDTVDRYHAIGLYRIVANTIEAVKTQNLSATDLAGMNDNAKTLDDIQALATAFKSFPDARSQKTYGELIDFIDSERRLQARMQRRQEANAQYPVVPTARNGSAADFDARAVDDYHASYSRLVSTNLNQLRAKNIGVSDLVEMNDNVKSLDDIQRLADGFKKLADSLPEQ